MRPFIVLSLLAAASSYGQQPVSPNLDFNLPYTGQLQWGNLLNANTYKLDGLGFGYQSGWLWWPLTAKGDVYTFCDGAPTKLPVGTDAFSLVADSTQPCGIKWAAGAGGTPVGPTGALQYYNAGLFAAAPLGTSTTLYHGNGTGPGSFGPVNLATDVSGALPLGGGLGGTSAAGTVSAIPSLAADYTAKNDFVMINHLSSGTLCSVSGSGVLTCTTATFVPSDVGKYACVGLWSGSNHHCALISAYVDSHDLQLADSPASAIASAVAGYGHDDCPAYTNAAANGQTVQLPSYVNTGLDGGSLLLCSVTITHSTKIYGVGGVAKIFTLQNSATLPAFTFNATNSYSASQGLGGDGGFLQMGLEKISMQGPGALFNNVENSYGVLLTTHANNVSISDTAFLGYSLALKTVGTIYNNFHHDAFVFNTVAFSQNSDGETIVFEDCFFNNNGAGIATGGGFPLDISGAIVVSGGSNVTFNVGSIINTQIVNAGTSGTQVVLSHMHVETPGIMNDPVLKNTGTGEIDMLYPEGILLGSHMGEVITAFAQNSATGVMTFVGSGSYLGEMSNATTGLPYLLDNSAGGSFSVRNWRNGIDSLSGPQFKYFNTFQGGYLANVEGDPNPRVITTATIGQQDDRYVICDGGSAAYNFPLYPANGQEVSVSNISTSATCQIATNTSPANFPIVSPTDPSGGSTSYTVAINASAATFIFQPGLFGNGAWVLEATNGAGSALPAQSVPSYLVSNGTTATFGQIVAGPSNCLIGTGGYVDIVTSCVPRVAAANTFTGVDIMQQLVLATTTFAAIPIACSGSTDGKLARINDSPTQTWGTAVTVGGGSLRAALICDSSVPGWTVFGK